MKTAIITLSEKGALLADRLREEISADLYCHSSVPAHCAGDRFDRVVDLMDRLFDRYAGIVCIMPVGVVVRAVGPRAKSKYEDPAVVAIDVGGRYAVSLLSGHEGRANELALRMANILDAEPVITTSSEAEKVYIVGIGCRKNEQSAAIVGAVRQGADEAGIGLEDIRCLASADIKKDEAGLLEASRELGIPLIFIGSERIRDSRRNFEWHQFVQEKVNLPGVAEPAALLAGSRTRIVLPRTVHNHVTVAIAKESCLWSV